MAGSRLTKAAFTAYTAGNAEFDSAPRLNRLLSPGEENRPDVKFLLAPFAILAFVLFLLVLGAIGLAISMAVLGALGRVWRLVSGADRHERQGRQQA